MDALTGQCFSGIQWQYFYLLSLRRFSRRIMWLEGMASNNNPQIVSFLFTQCVKALKGEILSNDIVLFQSVIIVYRLS